MKDKLKRFAVGVITGLLFLAEASVWSGDVKAQIVVPSDWAAKPSGLTAGQQFRLIFITSTTTTAQTHNELQYDLRVRDAAGANPALKPHKTRFNALMSTRVTHAITHVQMTGPGTGISIWWVGGDKVADNYTDFWDGSWDNEALSDLRDERGRSVRLGAGTENTSQRPWTGTSRGGQRAVEHHAGSTVSNYVVYGDPGGSAGPIDGGQVGLNTDLRKLYGVSPVFQVGAEVPSVTISASKTTYNEPATAGSHDVGSVTATTDGPLHDNRVGLAISGTASGADYARSEFTTPFPFRDTQDIRTRNKTLYLKHDTIDEPDETIILTLQSGSGYKVGTPGSTTITIRDNDPTIVSLARVGTGNVTEGQSATFKVTLGRALLAGEIVDVPLSVTGLKGTTAVPTSKWTLTATGTGTTLSSAGTTTPKLRFSGAEAETATLTMAIAGDNRARDQGGRTFTVALGPDGAGANGFDHTSLGTNVGGGANPHATSNTFSFNTVDGDVIPVLSVSGGGSITEGGSVVFQVTANMQIDGVSGGTIHYVVSQSGNVLGSGDIGSKVFTIISTGLSITIPTIDNTDYDPDGSSVTFTLVENPHSDWYDVGTASATVNVSDNDIGTRSVYLEQVGTPSNTITEGNSGETQKNLRFIYHGAQLDADIEVEVCTTSTGTRDTDGTYVAGEDFVARTLNTEVVAGCQIFTVTPANTTPKQFGPADGRVKHSVGPGLQLGIYGDTDIEPDETITVTMRLTENPGDVVSVRSDGVMTFTIKRDDIYSLTCAPKSSSVNKSNLTITEDRNNVRVINYPENGKYYCSLPGIDVSGATGIPLPTGVSGTFQFVWPPSPDRLDFQSGWNNDRFDGTLCGEVFNRGGHKWQLCVVDDDNAPPSGMSVQFQDQSQSVSVSEGQEITQKLIIGKPTAASEPCFVLRKPGSTTGISSSSWYVIDKNDPSYNELSDIRPIAALALLKLDRKEVLNSDGCIKTWSAGQGNILVDLYVNTIDDNVVGADQVFQLGLRSTRKDGTTETDVDTNWISINVVNDDHSDVIVVEPHPWPRTWVETITSASDKDFSDGTNCSNYLIWDPEADNGEGGKGARVPDTPPCAKYFARHATHLKWSTGRPPNFNYGLWADRGHGSPILMKTLTPSDGYTTGEWPLPSDFQRCNDAETRATSITITVRQPGSPGELTSALDSPPLSATSKSFRNCAYEMPGRDYYSEGEAPGEGMRSEPPPDVGQYPATEFAYAQIIVANPYVDIRNARQNKFVQEGRRARFFVELSGEATQDVTVKWRVRPAVERPRASLGEDVEKASGTLIIPQGETRGTIRVKTYEDEHDDDMEKFRVRIVSADGAVIRQQRAHGIIRNEDAMPAQWLKDYGLAVAEQTLDGVVRRAANFRFPPSPGMHIAPGTTPVEGQTISRVEALIDGASVSATSASGWSAWALTSRSTFDDEEDGLQWEGESIVVQGGVDVADDDWLFGTSFGHSRGDGSYHRADTAHEAAHAVLSDLTYIAPYAAYDAAEGRTAYGTVGWGAGSVTLTPHGKSSIQAPVNWWMAAVGGSQSVYELGAFDASLIGDVLYTGISSGDTSELRETRSHSAKAGGGVEVSADWDPISVSLQTQWRWDDEEESYIEYGGSASYTFGAFEVSGSGSVSEASESFSAGLLWTPRHLGSASLDVSSDGAWSVGWAHGPFHVTHSGDEVRLSSSINF